MVSIRLDDDEVAGGSLYLALGAGRTNGEGPRGPRGGRRRSSASRPTTTGCNWPPRRQRRRPEDDLRKGPQTESDDDELIAWIKQPERLRPGIAMPTWDGVIKEEEYPPLVDYVRSLARAAAAASAPTPTSQTAARHRPAVVGQAPPPDGVLAEDSASGAALVHPLLEGLGPSTARSRAPAVVAQPHSCGATPRPRSRAPAPPCPPHRRT